MVINYEKGEILEEFVGKYKDPIPEPIVYKILGNLTSVIYFLCVNFKNVYKDLKPENVFSQRS